MRESRQIRMRRRLLLATGTSVACHVALVLVIPAADPWPGAAGGEGAITIVALERDDAARGPAAAQVAARPPAARGASANQEKRAQTRARQTQIALVPSNRAAARPADRFREGVGGTGSTPPADGVGAGPTPPERAPSHEIASVPDISDGADLRPKCSSCPAPKYPARARRQGWQGTVDVDLRVGSNGAVEYARVARSSGYALLDNAAVTVARRSRFWLSAESMGLNGQLRYRFVLEEADSRRPL